MSRTPARRRGAAPRLGEHNRELLREGPPPVQGGTEAGTTPG
jgi:hypothetical protein